MTTEAPEVPAEAQEGQASPPARIRKSAAAELRELVRDVRTIRSLVLGLVAVSKDPRGVGVPLGPCEVVYYHKLNMANRVVLYTIADDGAVVVEGFRRVTAL